MNRVLISALLVASTSCMKAPLPPAPEQLTVTKSPGEATQIAARELTAAGFEITTSDAANGTVVATRLRTPEAHAGDVACKFQKGSIHDRRADATLVVTVNARPAADGSQVQISSVVRTDLSRVPPPFAKEGTNETDCVSAGAVEKRVAAALR